MRIEPRCTRLRTLCTRYPSRDAQRAEWPNGRYAGSGVPYADVKRSRSASRLGRPLFVVDSPTSLGRTAPADVWVSDSLQADAQRMNGGSPSMLSTKTRQDPTVQFDPAATRHR